MVKKYVVIISVVIFFSAGLALADLQQWTRGNFQYTRVGDGIRVVQIHKVSQDKITNSTVQNKIKTTTSPQLLNIVSVSSMPDINVVPGTDLSDINFPTTATVTLSDSTAKVVRVLWDNGTPAYDSNTMGTYAFSGALVFSGDISNTGNINASVNVVIASVSVIPPVDDDQSLIQTTSPSLGGGIFQQTASALLNGVSDFLKFLSFQFKIIFHH